MKTLSLKEAAKFLGITPAYLRLLVKDNLIPHQECKDKCCTVFRKKAIVSLRINKLKLRRKRETF
jgi:hypothetical protein